MHVERKGILQPVLFGNVSGSLCMLEEMQDLPWGEDCGQKSGRFRRQTHWLDRKCHEGQSIHPSVPGDTHSTVQNTSVAAVHLVFFLHSFFSTTPNQPTPPARPRHPSQRRSPRSTHTRRIASHTGAMFRNLPTFKSLPQAIGLPFLSSAEDAQVQFKAGENGLKRLSGEDVSAVLNVPPLVAHWSTRCW